MDGAHSESGGSSCRGGCVRLRVCGCQRRSGEGSTVQKCAGWHRAALRMRIHRFLHTSAVRHRFASLRFTCLVRAHTHHTDSLAFLTRPTARSTARLCRCGCRPHVSRATRQHDVAAVGELCRIRQQVDDDLAEAHAVALDDARHAALHHLRHVQPLLAGRLVAHVHGRLQAVGEVELATLQLQLAALDAVDVQHVVDERQQQRAAGLDELQVVRLLARQSGGQQQPHGAQHGVHRRAYLVRHVRQELALHRRRQLRQPLRLQQLRLHTAPLLQLALYVRCARAHHRLERAVGGLQQRHQQRVDVHGVDLPAQHAQPGHVRRRERRRGVERGRLCGQQQQHCVLHALVRLHREGVQRRKCRE